MTKTQERTLQFLKRLEQNLMLRRPTQIDTRPESNNFAMAEVLMDEFERIDERLDRIEQILREKVV